MDEVQPGTLRPQTGVFGRDSLLYVGVAWEARAGVVGQVQNTYCGWISLPRIDWKVRAVQSGCDTW